MSMKIPRRTETKPPAGEGDNQPRNEAELLTPAYTPHGTEHRELEKALAQLNVTYGRDPRADHTQCEWCAEVDRPTEFRVYRRPDWRMAVTPGPADVCVGCLMPAVRTAQEELHPSDDHPIHVDQAGEAQ